MRAAAPLRLALAAALGAVFGCAGVALGSAPAPVPHTVSSEAAGTRATLTWSEPAGGGPANAASGIELAIHQSAWQPGTSLIVPVRSADCSPCGVETPPGGSPLTVADLEGYGRVAVVVRLTTGGAHCCSVVQFHVTFPEMPGTYSTFEKNFGDPGMVIGGRGADGHIELISADDRFAYAFAPYAYSGLPLQIWELHEMHLVDVTRSYPPAIAADARRQLKGFLANRRQGLGNGLIAAWAADEEMLGKDVLVRATLAREARHGRLRSREHYGPSGRSFVVGLLRFLKRTGYR
jgi:hypothetical protein